jgi:hypothetical protein
MSFGFRVGVIVRLIYNNAFFLNNQINTTL